MHEVEVGRSSAISAVTMSNWWSEWELLHPSDSEVQAVPEAREQKRIQRPRLVAS